MPAPCSASTLKRLAWCKMGNGKKSIFDPRAGLWILIAANIIAFSDHTLWVELALVALLLALMVVHRRFTMAVKWAVGYCALLVFQQVILPASPMIIATSFTIFATYTRRMFPCLMTGSLMLKCTPLRYLIVGLRQLHIPQKLIVAISVTLRYFPAIREEIGHIRDAMKLLGGDGDAPHGVRYGDGRGALRGGRDPRNRKASPEDQRRVPAANAS